MTTTAESTALYRLMAWLSPAYPVGAFSYSHGLEQAVVGGLVHDPETTAAWIEDLLRHGSGFADAVLLGASHDAAAADDHTALAEVAALAAAFMPTSEIALESTAQGAAFLRVTRAAWPCTALDLLTTAWIGPYAYPVAVAVAAAGHGIGKEVAAAAYLQAFAANLVSAAVRLVPLGQTDGQRITAGLEGVVSATAERAMGTALDDIGTATPGAELCSMWHETQYTRLFRS